MEGQFLMARKDRVRLRLVLWVAVGAVSLPAEWPLLLVLAIFAVVVEILAMTFNRRGCFRIENGGIHARYHWFGKLEPKLDDIAFVHSQTLTLTILLKNGKRYTIGGLVNATELREEIQRNIFTGEQETPAVLRNQMESVHGRRRRILRWTIGTIAMMFVNIALAVMLTGGREFSDYSGRDWLLFSIMAAIEAVTVTVAFATASRCGGLLLDLAYLRYRLQGAVIASQLLPSASVKAVYTDADRSGRVVVCGLPNDSSLYYIVQEFDSDFRLVTVETSRFFDDEPELMRDLAVALIDVTSWYCLTE